MSNIVRLLVVLFVGVFCASAQASASATEVSSLPLLPEGQHVGMHIGFNVRNPPATSKAIEKAREQAIEAGMSVDVFHVDWALLENGEGDYNKWELQERLDHARELGLAPLVFLPAIDSEEFVVPADLKGEGPLDLVDGRRLDDPAIVRRYEKLLDWVIPMAVEYGAWGIIVGNEPDNHFEEHPEMADEFVNFLNAVRKHAHKVHPDMAVAMTVNSGDIEKEDGHLARSIVQHSDFAAYNFYCEGMIEGRVSLEEVQSRIDLRMQLADGKAVVFQELGCASGSPDISSPMKSSVEKQSEWFQSFFAIMEKNPDIRAAYLFQLVDGDSFFTQLYSDALKAEGLPQEFINYVAESVGTLGLIRYDDGSFKPGWKVFLDGIRAVSHDR